MPVQELIRKILTKGINTTCNEYKGYSSLHLAAMGGMDKIVRELIYSGAELANDYYAGNALHLAVESASIEMVDVLIKAGANVNGLSHYGYTALEIALESGFEDIAKLLIELGAYRKEEFVLTSKYF